MIVMILFLLTGCSDLSKYDDEDTAAIVRGEEITIGELRLLYPDEEVLNMIDGTVKAKLVVQEAKKMNIDVSEEIEEMAFTLGVYPSKDIESQSAISTSEFAESQAKKLGMSPEEFHQKYIELTSETGAYINAYIQEVIDVPIENVEEFDEQANKHLNELVRENQDEIKIFIGE
ncbi:hypothetical protein [Oceanobacillus sp. CAU 1775]